MFPLPVGFSALLLFCFASYSSSAAVRRESYSTNTCRKTEVAILGAGVAGIAAGQALSNQSIHDFVIVEYNGEIGGRVQHTKFGKDKRGKPITIELGANWVQGLGTKGGPENPIWTFAKKYKLSNTYSDFDSILTYNETGYVDYTSLLDEFDDAFTIVEQAAGVLLSQNLQDQSMRTGLSLADWNPRHKENVMAAQAVEWWEWDWEVSWTPEESAEIFGIAGFNTTFYQYSDENNFVFDSRGFNTFVKGEASTFLRPGRDSRLLLNTVVDRISYSPHGVTVFNRDGTCISAQYAISTFSLGVLQNNAVSFEPKLPDWKQTAVAKFQMGTYTKIFLQFNETFWPADKQFFLYASPTKRGYYPVWQSLSTAGFLPGSNIIFVTVVGDEAYRVERQSDEQTKAEVMAVLREMFPNITVPEPTAFLYPRWTNVPWSYGSYSNWPVGTSLEMHQNLRANVDRLYFAGEATSAEYFGFLHGAWFEGKEVGERIASQLKHKRCKPNEACGEETHYEVLHGTTPPRNYDLENGWDVTSFQTIGFD